MTEQTNVFESQKWAIHFNTALALLDNAVREYMDIIEAGETIDPTAKSHAQARIRVLIKSSQMMFNVHSAGADAFSQLVESTGARRETYHYYLDRL